MSVMDKVQRVIWDQHGVQIVENGRAGWRMPTDWDVIVDGRWIANVGSRSGAEQIAEHQARPSMRARRAQMK